MHGNVAIRIWEEISSAIECCNCRLSSFINFIWILQNHFAIVLSTDNYVISLLEKEKKHDCKRRLVWLCLKSLYI